MTTTLCPWVVSVDITSRAASRSFLKDAAGVPAVEGRVTVRPETGVTTYTQLFLGP